MTAAHRFRVGWFRIGEELVTTAEACVLRCDHEPTRRAYLLRTPIGEPTSLISAPLERINARATAAATATLYPRLYFGTDPSPAAGRLLLPEYYGVVDHRYLLPASATYRRRGAVGGDVMLAVSTSAVLRTEFWENLRLLLVAETGLLLQDVVAYNVWADRWEHLIRESALGQELLDQPLDGAPGRLISQIEALASQSGRLPGPTLQDSAIVRLLVAALQEGLPDAAVAATLECPFFRLNITLADLSHTVALYNLLRPQTPVIPSPEEWLGPAGSLLPTVVDALLAQPMTLPDQPSHFEPCPAPDDETLAGFTALVQDPERTLRPYLVLDAS